jgi:superfamily II DNA/RNA helicase
LLEGLQTLKENFPRHIIFCETITTVSKIYSAFLKKKLIKGATISTCITANLQKAKRKKNSG